MVPNQVRYDGMAFPVGVYAIGDVQRFNPPYPFQNERDQVSAGFPGYILEHAPKSPGIVRPHVGRHLHAGQNQAGLGVSVPNPFQDT